MKQSGQGGRAGSSRRIPKRILRERRTAAIRLPRPGLGGKAAMPDPLVERILQSDRLLLIGKLSAPAAHEIINPVSASLNLATLMQHILRDEGIPADRVAEFRGYLAQVIGETARAGRIASEVLAFARASSREPVRTDLNEVVRQAFPLVSHLFKLEDVESRFELAGGLPRVWCHVPQMQQALLNLLVNAAEAVENCERRWVTVGTRLRGDGGAVVLEVRDTGEGIPSKELPRIFEPFYTTRKKPENLGLGLTIARRIVEEHQGSIEVTSGPEEGTTVRVTVPVEGNEEHDGRRSGKHAESSRGR